MNVHDELNRFTFKNEKPDEQLGKLNLIHQRIPDFPENETLSALDTKLLNVVSNMEEGMAHKLVNLCFKYF